MKIIISIIVILFCLQSNAQKCVTAYQDVPSTTLYGSFQPFDYGVGLRLDFYPDYWFGLYSSLSYGAWRFYKASGLNDHVKASFGVLIPYKPLLQYRYHFIVGINYHWVSGQVDPSDIYREHWTLQQPMSFELGLNVGFKRFSVGVRTDILRWEPCVDIGIPL